MIFGIPILVIGIVCYALCCMEPFDEADWDEIAREIREQKLRDIMEEGKLHFSFLDLSQSLIQYWLSPIY